MNTGHGPVPPKPGANSRVPVQAGAELLGTQDLVAGYNGVPIVHRLNLSVAAGEVVVLLGANGAGKTTTMHTLAGGLAPIDGVVRINGTAVTGPAHRRCRRRLSFVTEERAIFRSMTVADNLRLGRGGMEAAVAVLPELGELLRRRAGLLSGGEQQMLALARAVAAQPAVLLADELSLGLAPMIVRRLLDAVRAAANAGLGVLMVEQHVRQALAIADRGYVLRRGRVVVEGTAAQLRARLGEIEASYLSGIEAQ